MKQEFQIHTVSVSAGDYNMNYLLTASLLLNLVTYLWIASGLVQKWRNKRYTEELCRKSSPQSIESLLKVEQFIKDMQ